MLLAFVVAGRGIGASGAMTRFVACVQHGLFPAATEQSVYFGKFTGERDQSGVRIGFDDCLIVAGVTSNTASCGE